MNIKFFSVVLVAFFCYATICMSESPLTYIEASYPSVNLPQESRFRFSEPGTDSVITEIIVPKKTFLESKLHTIPDFKYALQTIGKDDNYHHEPSQYEFQYQVHDDHHGPQFEHREYKLGNIAKGQYVVLLPDGRRQIVDYIADSHGYRPTIRYEAGFGFR